MVRVRSIIYSLITLVIVGGGIVYSPFALGFSGGTGTDQDPYLISDCDELQSITELDASYQLTQDINCSGTSSWDSGAGFLPIGTVAAPFTGTLDGQLHTIVGLTINRSGDPSVPVGLFGVVDGGTIKNIGLFNATITGDGVTGGLVGIMGQGFIENVGVGATITSQTGQVPEGFPAAGVGAIAGIIGSNTLISRAGALGSVHILQASSSIIGGGGIVGLLSEPSTLTNSFSQVDVTSEAPGQVAIGGLVGFSLDFGMGPGATIENSYAKSTLGLADGNLGGLLAGGIDNGTVSNSFAYGSYQPPLNAEDVLYTGTLIGDVNAPLVSTNNYVSIDGTNPAECFTSQESIDNCTVIDYTLAPNYFYDEHNGPYPQWDFTNLWQLPSGDFPYLRTDIVIESNDPGPGSDPIPSSEEPQEQQPATTSNSDGSSLSFSSTLLPQDGSAPIDENSDETNAPETNSDSPAPTSDDDQVTEQNSTPWGIIFGGSAAVIVIAGAVIALFRSR